MYDTFKTLHSYWAYIVIIVLLAAIISALMGKFKKREYLAKNFRIALFGLIVSHIQLVIGLILYFVSPRFDLWGELGGEVMSNAIARLYLVEHPIVNILAIVMITIGYSKHKRKTASTSKFNIVLVFYSIGLLLLLSRIPYDVWPNW